VEGIGEQMTPLSLPRAQFLVVKPTGGASTQKNLFGTRFETRHKACYTPGLCCTRHAKQIRKRNRGENPMAR